MGPTTYLYVPGNKLDFVEKAFNKGAENIFIDLEDSIPVQLKSTVRDSVCNFLKEGKPSNIYVRINSIDSFQEEDISALNKIKFKNIVIPKLEKNSAIIKSALLVLFAYIPPTLAAAFMTTSGWIFLIIALVSSRLKRFVSRLFEPIALPKIIKSVYDWLTLNRYK